MVVTLLLLPPFSHPLQSEKRSNAKRESFWEMVLRSASGVVQPITNVSNAVYLLKFHHINCCVQACLGILSSKRIR